MTARPGAQAEADGADAAAENVEGCSTTANPTLRPKDSLLSSHYIGGLLHPHQYLAPLLLPTMCYTYGDGKMINFTDLILSGLNTSFTDTGSVPATLLTPCDLVNPEAQLQTPQDKDSSA